MEELAENIDPFDRDAALACVRQWVHVAVPYHRLMTEFWDLVADRNLNLELGMDHVSLERYDFAHFEKTAGSLAGRGVAVTFHAPFIDLAPGALEPSVLKATRRRLAQVIPLAEIFDPLTVVCHAGWDRRVYGFAPKWWMNAAVDTFLEFADELAEKSRARLVLENVFEEGPEMLEKLLDRLEGRAGFCLDPGHVLAFSRTPLSRWLEALGPCVEEIHVHDNNGKDDDHLGAGRGKVEFPLLLDYVAAMEKPPVVTIEAHSPEGVGETLEYLAGKLTRPPYLHDVRKEGVLREKTFTVQNISCRHCVAAIKNELSEQKGVIKVTGDPAKKQVTVQWDEPATEES
ncbi:MAG: TIM barrel protein, partial [Deltaproteobacteria bacterium]|nr:TIM barrel protein [Deltaproteobacteria bacterium]